MSGTWTLLESHRATTANLRMADEFAKDAKRAANFSLEAAGLFLDYSKNRITAEKDACRFEREGRCAFRILRKFISHTQTGNRSPMRFEQSPGAAHFASARTERDASVANASRGVIRPSITAHATSVIGIATP